MVTNARSRVDPQNLQTIDGTTCMKRTISILALAVMCGCSRKQDFSCVDRLAARLPVGTSGSKAEQALKECGLEYSLDRQARVFHAVVRGRKEGLTREDRVVLIKLDSSENVTWVEVKTEFTGP